MNRKTAIGFLVFGIIVLVLGIYMNFFKGKDYVETTATITKIEEIDLGTDADGDPEYDHKVYVKYTVDGKEYSGESDFYQSSYNEGDEITIFYNPDDPSQITGDSKGFGIYVIVVGIVLILGSVVMFIRG